MFQLVRAQPKKIVSAGLLVVGSLSVQAVGQAKASASRPQKTTASESLGQLPPALSLTGHGGWGDSSGNKGSYRSSLNTVHHQSGGVVMTSEYEGEGLQQSFSVLLQPVVAGFLIYKDAEPIGSGHCQERQQCTMRYDGEQAVTETLFLQGSQWLRFGQKTVEGNRIFWFEVL